MFLYFQIFRKRSAAYTKSYLSTDVVFYMKFYYRKTIVILLRIRLF